ncbi:uncharacterized protein LOC129875767 [Solanum dulcamara]|uniref:uncharacterized protein LOC129875767 n=1 Tax=Solanum dulcamara TaxID=45834 RepID=UPI0024853F38|nr:uncharacterized protein LOC129875767 [Solanum dulcamara]
MAECFNAWILAARHKTIITMLEEIRVKMIKKIGQMREFCNSCISNISPMAMKVLQENTTKFMKYKIEWNSDTGYEVLHGEYKHIVDVNGQTCSCRAWMLKGIPFLHAIAAFHHRKLEPIDYISNWYNREAYMKTYNHFIQPLLNMKMWPESQNISVIPPHIRKMPERPSKARRK